MQNLPWILPAKRKPLVYTFPTLHRNPIRLPTSQINELLEKFDPLSHVVVPLKAPSSFAVAEKRAGERMLKIRRHKMIKHKRMKRHARDYFKNQKYHREKKAKAEFIFRQAMTELINEYRRFDPVNYVRETIACAKQDVMKGKAASGRHIHPHWSTLVTLEKLYGLSDSDYIDKKAGLPDPEEWKKMRELFMDYRKNYSLTEIQSEKVPQVTENLGEKQGK